MAFPIDILLAAILFIVIVVFAVAVAGIRRDLAQLASKKEPPAGSELGKVRENIEQLLDVLEERSTSAERQLRQLIEEAKAAAQQIDEATAAAVKVLDTAASSKSSPSAVEASAARQAEAPPMEPNPPEPSLPTEEPAGALPAYSSGASSDDLLLEPISTGLADEAAVPAAKGVIQNIPEDAPTPPPRIVNDTLAGAGNKADPLSAWAPYTPASRGKERPPEELPAAAPIVEAAQTADNTSENTSEQAEEGAVENSDEDVALENTDFRPFAIVPIVESREVDTAEPGVVGSAQPELPAAEELIELSNEQDFEHAPLQSSAQMNGEALANGEAPVNGETAAEARPAQVAETKGAPTGQASDPYSAVYTLTELGVTDVSEIAKRTGLGQTEVEMVLNLWKRQ